MTINQLIRELLTLPKKERMKDLPWQTICIKTKDGHEIQVTSIKKFIGCYQEIPITFDVIQPRQISDKIH